MKLVKVGRIAVWVVIGVLSNSGFAEVSLRQGEEKKVIPSVDVLHDDYMETDGFSGHAYGLMTYGFHSNTFHVRQFLGRVNYQKGMVQMFATLLANKDTHDPDTNYVFSLGNVSMYDVGGTVQTSSGFYFSLRGAATFRESYLSYLLLPPYYYRTNEAEFDSRSQYNGIFPTGPGIRIGYNSERFQAAYSQGDNRHTIPRAVLLRYSADQWFVRALIFQMNPIPETFLGDKKSRFPFQVVAGGSLNLGVFQLKALVDGGKNDESKAYLRLEQAVGYESWLLGLREIMKQDDKMLFEAALQYYWIPEFSLGLQVRSNGDAYLGSQLAF